MRRKKKESIRDTIQSKLLLSCCSFFLYIVAIVILSRNKIKKYTEKKTTSHVCTSACVRFNKSYKTSDRVNARCQTVAREVCERARKWTRPKRAHQFNWIYISKWCQKGVGIMNLFRTSLLSMDVFLFFSVWANAFIGASRARAHITVNKGNGRKRQRSSSATNICYFFFFFGCPLLSEHDELFK